MVEVIPIDDERLKKVLSYPHFSESHYCKVLSDLREIGVRGVISQGGVDLPNFKVLGKGCVGVVLLGLLGENRVALKVLRSDADRKSLRKEGEILKEVNTEQIGPRTVAVRDNVIAMEYISGDFLSKWLKTQNDGYKVRAVVKELLRQCWKLDEMGIDHGELSDAKKHVLVDGQGTPRIIDFESASKDRTCRNIVSIAGYLFFKRGIAEYLRLHLSWNDNNLKELLRQYKRARSPEVYREILEELGLQCAFQK
ncbi:MAG: RIO1 family regulatory kinase/ATPase [Candidatus Bathyarchaeia archaeon]